MDELDHLTVLGHEVRHPIEHVEVFPKPFGVSAVTFTGHELVSMCPVTKQPDISSVVIEYRPDQLCVESKSLKLYLWSFRDRAIFAEAIAAEIAKEIVSSSKALATRVTVTQQPRGGLTLTAVSSVGLW